MASQSDEDIFEDQVDYKELSPEKKERYVFRTLSDLIHEYPEGVTRSDMLEATPFGRKTLDKHLERLVALNEAYVRRMGGTDVYYPNGRMLRPNAVWEMDAGNKQFKLTLLENITGQSLYLQEVEESDYGEEAKGGLLIPRSEFSEFVEWLCELEEEVVEFHE